MTSLLAPHPEVWVYLATSPLSWLTLTLIAYVVADRISMAFNRHPAVNLVAIASLLIILALKATGTNYESYFSGAQFIHFLLGPATVALAAARDQRGEQQEHAEHRAGQRQSEGADEKLAQQLAGEYAREGGDHFLLRDRDRILAFGFGHSRTRNGWTEAPGAAIVRRNWNPAGRKRGQAR